MMVGTESSVTGAHARPAWAAGPMFPAEPERSVPGVGVALRTVLQSAADGVMLTDGSGVRLFANLTLDAIVGGDARLPLSGGTPPAWLPEDQHAEYRRLAARAALLLAEGGGCVDGALALVDRRGNRRAVAVTLETLRTASGAPVVLWLLRAEPVEPAPCAGGASSSGRWAGGELDPLTRRESHVLRLVLDGRRVSSIAKGLNLSEHTVRNHLKAIFRKLDVHSQADLIDRFRPVDLGPVRPGPVVTS